MRRAIVLAALPLAVLVGCRHRVTPAPAPETPCWTNVASSALPVERLARRYMDAFHAVGVERTSPSGATGYETLSVWRLGTEPR